MPTADLVDRQSVIVNFKNGSTASFSLVGGTIYSNRSIHIIGTDGEISDNLNEGIITLRKTSLTREANTKTIDVNKDIHQSLLYNGHMGGDFAIMHDLVHYLGEGESSISITPLEDSLFGHLVVYGAEKSRKEGTIVSLSLF